MINKEEILTVKNGKRILNCQIFFMKRRLPLILTFLAAIFLLLSVRTNAQVYNGDLVLESQADVDRFNYSEVTGNLTIEEISEGNIKNLNSLSSLVYVGGFLILYQNTELSNVDGLANLISVGGRFTIYNNEALTNLNGLTNLTDIGGTLSISSNNALVNLDGLNSLNYIGGDLNINSNNSLTNIEGLSSLSWISGGLGIAHTSVLTNLDGLSEITSLQYLTFHSADGLTDINGLSSLDSIKGQFSMDGCRSLTNLDGLSHLSYVGGNFTLWGNSLTNIHGLINLETIQGGINIGYNRTLISLDGLDGVSSFAGNLRIVYNDVLVNIDPLSNFSVVDSLEISDNPLLAYLPFDNLISVGKDLIIRNNDALLNLDGLASLISIGANFQISENDALNNTAGLANINNIGGGLTIRSNSSLSFIDGLNLVPSLGLDLEISDNASLTNIQQLENIGSIGGSITISGNTSLPFVSFSDLTTVGDSIKITNNSSLSNIYISEIHSIPRHFYIQNNDALIGIDLTKLNSVGGNLIIGENISLTNIDGLSSLSSVGGILISNNSALTSINGLSGLTSAGHVYLLANHALDNIEGLSALSTVAEYLVIHNNTALTNVDGLSGLISVGGNLNIQTNNALINISGLSGLTSVGGILNIQSNDALINFNGLSGLLSVGGPLFIYDNASLTNIDALHNLTSVGEYLTIQDNINLSGFCGLYKLLSPDPGSNGLTGTYTVIGNAVNPTEQQIIDNGICCSVSQTTFYRDADGDGYGNPSLTTLACSAPLGYVSNNADCDDTKPAMYPGATEVCNNLDDNCDGQVDEVCNRFIKVNIYGGLNPYNNPEWNNWNTNASLSLNNLRYSDGTVSSVRVALSQQTGISDNGTGYNTTMAPPEVNRYASYSTVNRTLTISGLDDTKTYNLEIYASRKGVSNNTTRFVTGSTSFNILTDNNLTNKASFYSLVPSSGTIIISLERLNTYSYINGFVLTTTGSTPPPPPPASAKFVKVNIFGGMNPYNNSEWNNWNSASSLSSGNLRYSDGTISLISAAINQQNGISDNGIPYNTTMAPPEVMRYASYSTTSRILTISGLDNSKTYNLEIYASRKGVTNNTTRFTIGSVLIDIVTDNNLVNKASFTNLVPTSGQIIVNIARLNEFNYLSGFILSENSSVTISDQLQEIREVEPVNQSINIFPNPIKDRIVLQINNSYKGKMTVQVINMSGIIVKQFNLVKNQVVLTENLQVENLKQGNYIIRIQGDKWVEYKKVSKL